MSEAGQAAGQPPETDDGEINDIKDVNTFLQDLLKFMDLVKGVAAAFLSVVAVFGCQQIGSAREELAETRAELQKFTVSQESVSMWSTMMDYQNNTVNSLGNMAKLVDETLNGDDKPRIDMTGSQLANMYKSTTAIIAEIDAVGANSDDVVANRTVRAILQAQADNLLDMAYRIAVYCLENSCEKSPGIQQISEILEDNERSIKSAQSQAVTGTAPAPQATTPATPDDPVQASPKANQLPNAPVEEQALQDAPPARQSLQASRVRNVAVPRGSGWDVDIFYCAGIPGSEQRSDQIAANLVQAADNGVPIGSGIILGRIRTRALDDATAARLNANDRGRSTLFLRANSDAGEQDAARAIAARLARAVGGAVPVNPASTPTPWYISIFVCGPAAQ